MPAITRPDGVEIAWSEAGEGSPVGLANIGYAHGAVLQGLIDELASDHRVISYDPRGTGSSSRRGPYAIARDAEDLAAVLEAAEATDVVVLGNGDGADRAIAAAVERPELIGTVVVSGNLAMPGQGESEGLADSRSVLAGLLTLLEADYKAGVHAMLGPGNPELHERARQARVDVTVANCDKEAAVARIRAWIASDPTEGARRLGNRLWVLHYETNPWFSGSQRARTLLPDANHRDVADGPLARPDLIAAAIRQVTRSAAR